MSDDAATATIIVRGALAALLVIGGVTCIVLGFKALKRGSLGSKTRTTLSLKIGTYALGISAQAAATFLVGVSAVWVIGAVVVSPGQLKVDGERIEVASYQSPSFGLAAVPITGKHKRDRAALLPFEVQGEAMQSDAVERLEYVTPDYPSLRTDYVVQIGATRPVKPATDPMQAAELADRRIEIVKAQLQAAGVAAERIEVVKLEDYHPVGQEGVVVKCINCSPRYERNPANVATKERDALDPAEG